MTKVTWSDVWIEYSYPIGVASLAVITVCTAEYLRRNVRMSDLEATLTTLNNTINNTITDYTPVFGNLEEKTQLLHGDVIQVLGRSYVLPDDRAIFERDVESFLWFSYRRNFRAIGGTAYTSDRGWGCMLRCIQMLYSHTLIRHNFSRDWRWTKCSTYNSILRDFLDDPNGLYSIQQIAKAGCSAGKDVGTWFGPNTAAQSIRILTEFHKELNLTVQVVMDNFMCIEDIKFYCKEVNWTPLLLVIPLRLGLSECNNLYIENIKHCFEIEQSVGAVGGRPNSAFYFIGCQNDKLLYLDPHVTQESLSPDDIDLENIPDETYHTTKVDLLPWDQLDPSIAVAFYCKTEESFDDLCQQLQETIAAGSGALFEMVATRPSYMTPPRRTPIDKLLENYTAEYDEVNTEDAASDSDGFEIISNS
ncbi:cysteine protease ATG4B-like [Bolinopsis microptera]|uniref:cysteine protease ATG4B-like n=1 Tax=Bolinopsis microptera TaxID=2820187 RepID=UPI003079E40D